MITIDYQSKLPLYEQIAGRFQALILRGVLPPDRQMPSVRSLAVELSINPNTIQKAYSLLEQSQHHSESIFPSGTSGVYLFGQGQRELCVRRHRVGRAEKKTHSEGNRASPLQRKGNGDRALGIHRSPRQAVRKGGSR